MAFQSRDLIECMQQDSQKKLTTLKVDGGASMNNSLMQFQADILDTQVQRPVVAETTALGAAYFAGLAVGFWKDLGEVQVNWLLDKEFESKMDASSRREICEKWQKAVQRSLLWESNE